jgi:hypothetical protein
MTPQRFDELRADGDCGDKGCRGGVISECLDEIARLRQLADCMELINKLIDQKWSMVSLSGNRDDGVSISVHGLWTYREGQVFRGDTLLDVLNSALRKKEESAL